MLVRRRIHNLVAFIQIDEDRSASFPVQAIEDDQASRAGGNGIGQVCHAALGYKVCLCRGVDRKLFFHGELAGGFFACGVADAVIRIPRVLIHQHHIGPHAA